MRDSLINVLGLNLRTFLIFSKLVTVWELFWALSRTWKLHDGTPEGSSLAKKLLLIIITLATFYYHIISCFGLVIDLNWLFFKTLINLSNNSNIALLKTHVLFLKNEKFFCITFHFTWEFFAFSFNTSNIFWKSIFPSLIFVDGKPFLSFWGRWQKNSCTLRCRDLFYVIQRQNNSSSSPSFPNKENAWGQLIESM